MEIIADGKWKMFRYGYDIPKKIHTEYSHLGADDKDGGWILYRRRWYHLSDFIRIENGLFPKTWHGYASDSFFSGVLIEIACDGDMYRIGTYYS